MVACGGGGGGGFAFMGCLAGDSGACGRCGDAGESSVVQVGQQRFADTGGIGFSAGDFGTGGGNGNGAVQQRG